MLREQTRYHKMINKLQGTFILETLQQLGDSKKARINIKVKILKTTNRTKHQNLIKIA